MSRSCWAAARGKNRCNSGRASHFEPTGFGERVAMCCCAGSCQPDGRPESARRHDRSASDQRAMDPARSLCWRFRRHGARGSCGCRAGSSPSAEAALARQPGRRCPRYSDRAHSLSDGSGRRGACVRGARLGSLQLAAAPLPSPCRCSVLLLDLAIYLQHALFHAVPALWRLHRMHHADLDIDVTTGVRFHPVEIVLSMLIKFAVVAALGAPALAVLVFEVLLNATSMFNHSQRAHAAARRRHRALAGGDARHAPRAPLHHPGRDRQQFRLQLSLVGPAVRHLPARAARRPPRHDHRHRGVPRSSRAAPRPHADPAVPRRCGGPRRPRSHSRQSEPDRQSSPTLRE